MRSLWEYNSRHYSYLAIWFSVIGLCSASPLTTSISIASGTIEFNEDFKWIASDATSNEGFGWSTAISGNLAVIGANVGNASRGAGVYVFDVVSGQEQYKWFPTYSGDLDALGFSVDIDGTTAIAGMPGADDPLVGTHTGNAFLFDAVSGQQLHELVAIDGVDGDHFGQSVAIDGGLAVVGSKFHDLPGRTWAGQVYVYDVQTGVELSQLSLSSPGNPGFLGDAVDISNGKVIAGATNANGTPHLPAGAAYVFDAVTGALLSSLSPSDGASSDDFGSAVSISGNRAVVGAQGNDENGSDAGAAYVYDVTSGDELFKLSPLDATSMDTFGHSVDLVGNLALIGATQRSGPTTLSGAAYLFDISTGTQLAKYTASDATVGASFGISAALGEEFILVGAFRNESITGAVYGFRRVPEPSAIALLLVGVSLLCLTRNSTGSALSGTTNVGYGRVGYLIGPLSYSPAPSQSY